MIHGMLLTGFFRNLGGSALPSGNGEGIIETRETNFEKEVQVVASAHSSDEAR